MSAIASPRHRQSRLPHDVQLVAFGHSSAPTGIGNEHDFVGYADLEREVIAGPISRLNLRDPERGFRAVL
jgi:hypothetical protein